MKRMRQWLLACLLAGSALSAAHAHLVVSQRGTLNIVGDGAYMVLSLPVSSLSGFDDDHDGLLSVDELRAHGRKHRVADPAGCFTDQRPGAQCSGRHHAQHGTA
jgi:hypothetical protein